MFMRRMLFRFLLLTGCLVVASLSVSSQNSAANKWYFGNNAGLDFQSGNPVPMTNSAMVQFEGVSSIADSMTGQLLFYSNGLTVWNRNHLVMANGTGLLGNSSSTQSALIVPSPANNGIYYLFTINTGSTGLRYSIIDMGLNAGLGGVTSKNVMLRPGTTEQLAAVYHRDCNRVWLVCHSTGTTSYYTFLLSASGITGPFQTIAGGSSSWGIGQLKFSPDGSRLANRRSYNPDWTTICDFDNATGTISNCYEVNTGSTFDNYGCSFSPNGNLLYIVSYNGGALSQFDLLAGSPAAVQASRVVIGNPSGTASMQIGPDGRLYMVQSGATSLHRVNNPNVIGLGANFQLNAVGLAGRSGRLGLPNLNESYYSTVACNAVVLPMAWSRFLAEVEGETVFLSWEVRDVPGDLSHFLVQRSEDMAHWATVKRVDLDAGVSLSGDALAYNATDLPEVSGRFYYRIRKVNLNGSHAYSEAREVEVSALHPIRIFPNPVAAPGSINLHYTGLSTQPLRATLHTVEGKLVRDFVLEGRKSRLELGDLSPGMYLVKVTDGLEKWWSKLVVE